MRADLRMGVGTFSSLTGLRDAIAPVGTRPPQRMWAVLLMSTGTLSSHRFASSIDGSLAPCFNSTLFGDTTAAVWVQKNARWDGLPSSQFGQINSPKDYMKTSNRSCSICNEPLTPVTSTHICNSCCLAPVTYKRAKTTPGLASTTPVTNVDFW
jgi:hypothetical protein